MPRRNRVDPWGDLHAVSARGMFTGNRGCLVDSNRRLVRHHRGSLWIVCVTAYSNWRKPLDEPRTWTPLFFLDDAVALAAGHRPCGFCRRTDYVTYRDAVTLGIGADQPLSATDLNRRLSSERLGRGRGLERGNDRLLWRSVLSALPDGTMIADPADRATYLIVDRRLRRFGFEGWGEPTARPTSVEVEVLTPPTSVIALQNGYVPTLHPSAMS